MYKLKKFSFSFLALILTLIIIYFILRVAVLSYGDMIFDGERAFEDLAYQVSLGPRYPGSQAHQQTMNWIIDSLEREGWRVEIQSTVQSRITIKNIIAYRDSQGPWIILGAHYDTRMIADNDSDTNKRTLPILGANDGASGVAILLELARVLERDMALNVWLVFFDAEDTGNIDGLDWAMGSRAFVEQLAGIPDAVVIVDMVGDTDLNIHIERSSTVELAYEIWEVAKDLGHQEFFFDAKYNILDDHTAFLVAGIPAVDIIDFDYQFWHTTEDTLDKVSPRSLQVVGDTLLAWLTTK
jgi:Zn-dependent M28 family amino/carboxypeptidase